MTLEALALLALSILALCAVVLKIRDTREAHKRKARAPTGNRGTR